MKATEPAFLARLDEAATAAQREELRFRESIAAEITRRVREREFAFRRLGLAGSMVRAAAGATTPEAAIAAQVATLRRELGWHGESEQRTKVLTAWRSVAEAVCREVMPSDEQQQAPRDLPSVLDAMARFEAWYVAEFCTSYLALLDQDIPEMPVVEF